MQGATAGLAHTGSFANSSGKRRKRRGSVIRKIVESIGCKHYKKNTRLGVKAKWQAQHKKENELLINTAGLKQAMQNTYAYELKACNKAGIGEHITIGDIQYGTNVVYYLYNCDTEFTARLCTGYDGKQNNYKLILKYGEISTNDDGESQGEEQTYELLHTHDNSILVKYSHWHCKYEDKKKNYNCCFVMKYANGEFVESITSNEREELLAAMMLHNSMYAWYAKIVGLQT